MHLFPPCPHDLHGYHFGSLMIVGLDDFSESTSAEALQQFIAVAHLLVLAPEVPTLEIIFSKSGPNSNVVNCLFVDQFNTLILGQHLLIFLDHFFAGEPWQRLPEFIAVLQVTLLNHADFLLGFFYFLRCRLAGSAGLRVYLDLAAAGFAGSADLAVGDVGIEIFLLAEGGCFIVFPHGNGRVPGAFGVDPG